MHLPLRRKVALVHELLNRVYRTPDLGNRTDPVEELVFIALSRQTHHTNTARSWREIESHGGILSLHRMRVEKLERLLRPGGLSRQKARWIKAALRSINKRFGVLSLEAIRAWDDDSVEGFLCSLPGVSVKSAKCIMMYSMGRKVFPVDTHVRRLATRVGLVPGGLSEKRIHSELEALVRPDHRFALHVNAICHGRTVCTVRAPHCTTCVLRHQCQYAKGIARQRRFGAARMNSLLDELSGVVATR